MPHSPQLMTEVTSLSPTFRGLPAVSHLIFLPSATISPVPSWPRTTGARPKGSPFHSWTSVPQTPQPSTLTRMSLSPTWGMGNSLTSMVLGPVSMATRAVAGMPAAFFGAEAPPIWVRT